MNVVVLTLFPELFNPFWDHGMIGRAISQCHISVSTMNIRDYAQGRHQVTDDRPYGGGNGMVMKPEPLAAAIRAAMEAAPEARRILMTPQGRPFNQKLAWELAEEKGLILICGRYEGIDERICLDFVDDDISIGDYVLTGGEVAAMVIVDAVARLIPGVLGGEESATRDSFSDGLLEHAHYTRPPVFEEQTVPEVLVSGHHGKIETWRMESALIRTFLKRRDLFEQKILTHQELEILKAWAMEIEGVIKIQEQLKGRKRA